MGTKTIALDEKSYNSLSSLKKKDESFSDLVKRLMRPVKPLSSYAGVWKDMPLKLSSDVLKVIKETRTGDKHRLERLVKKVIK